MNIKVKLLHPNAVLPQIMRSGDAGADLTAVKVFHCDLFSEYSTGVSIAIPDGYVGFLYPRSSCSMKTQILANCVGVIDSNYRGEIKLRFKNTTSGLGENSYKVGDRVGQLIIQKIPEVTFEEVETLDETNRGENGFGSSGN